MELLQVGQEEPAALLIIIAAFLAFCLTPLDLNTHFPPSGTQGSLKILFLPAWH